LIFKKSGEEFRGPDFSQELPRLLRLGEIAQVVSQQAVQFPRDVTLGPELDPAAFQAIHLFHRFFATLFVPLDFHPREGAQVSIEAVLFLLKLPQCQS